MAHSQVLALTQLENFSLSKGVIGNCHTSGALKTTVTLQLAHFPESLTES